MSPAPAAIFGSIGPFTVERTAAVWPTACRRLLEATCAGVCHSTSTAMAPVLSLQTAPSHLASYDHAMDCMAGFCEGEAQALAAAQQLRNQCGLQANRGLVLGPANASWLLFTREIRSLGLGRHLESRSWLSDAPMMALLGGMTFGLIFAIGVFVVDVQDVRQAILLLLTGPAFGAAAGWAVSGLTAGASQYRRFNRDVRVQLAAGHWAVLAHHVPGPQQAGAAQLLRERSIGWCAVAAPWRLL